MTTPSIQEPGDWIEWSGEECPIPDDDTLHDVKLRRGKIYAGERRASLWRWTHDFSDSDIIAYRIVS